MSAESTKIIPKDAAQVRELKLRIWELTAVCRQVAHAMVGADRHRLMLAVEQAERNLSQ